MRGRGCRAAVREDLRPEIPGSGSQRQSGDVGLGPNLSSTDTHLLFLCWCQSQFFFKCPSRCPVFRLPAFLSFIFSPVWLGCQPLLIGARLLYHQDASQSLHLKIYAAKAFSSRALFSIQGCFGGTLLLW